MSKATQEQRMKEQLDSGNFYEYTQFIKTIFFKYKMRRKFTEMKDLIKKALIDLGQRENQKQQDLVADIFEIFYKEHVQKMRGSQADIDMCEDEYLYDLCMLLCKYGSAERTVAILESVTSGCVSNKFVPFNQKLCGTIGGIY